MLFLRVLPAAIIITIVFVTTTIVSVMTITIIVEAVVIAAIITFFIPMIVIRNTSMQCLLTIIIPCLLNAVDYCACK